MIPGAHRVGEHVLGRELGRGGMGVVHEAHHPRFGPVALKLVLVADPEETARMRREAAVLLRVRHPAIVPVHEAGLHEGLPFIAMALIPGESLHTRLQRGPLDARRAASITRALAEALAHLHAHGVVHRDVKPHNVILTLGTEAPVLVDFGLARAKFDPRSLTATGAVLGTPAYMAPEQAQGLEATPAVDVWALGATLYQMLCGRPPFAGSSALVVLAQVAEGTGPPPPSTVRAGVDPELERLCLALMRRDPRERMDLATLIAALDRWRPRRARPPRRRLAWAAAGLVALGGAAVAVVASPGAPAPATGVTTATTATTEADAGSATTAEATAAAPPAPAAPAPPVTPARRDDPAERQALAVLRRVVMEATRGRAAAADGLDRSEDAARLAPASAQVRLACAWVARAAARAGVVRPPEPMLARADEHLAAAERAGAAPADVRDCREVLARDREELAALEDELRRPLTDEVRLQRGVRLRSFSRHEEAVELLSVVATDPRAVTARYNLAGSLIMVGRPQEACDLYRELIAELEAQVRLGNASKRVLDFLLFCHQRLVDVSVLDRDWGRTLALTEAALQLPATAFDEGERGRLLAHRAQALVGLGRADEAVVTARRALDSLARDGLAGGDAAQPTAMLAAALTAAGRRDQAREVAARALDLAAGATRELPWIREGVHRLITQAFADDPDLVAAADAIFP